MKQHRVFPECNVDTNFVSHLLGGAVMHKSTCNEVVKAINGSDQFAVGIIDADKRLATMDVGFVMHKQNVPADGSKKHVTMYVHNDGKRYMFTVKPAMDKFILDAAKQQSVDMKAIGYSASLDCFKKETKRITAAKDPQLRRLFDLIKDNPEINRFKNTLKYLMCTKYHADSAVAKQFFDGTIGDEELAVYLAQANSH